MGPDAFRRLELLAASSLYVFGLALVARYLGVVVAGAILVLGALVTIVLTIEDSGPKGSPEGPGAEGLSRRAIARLARKSDDGE